MINHLRYGFGHAVSVGLDAELSIGAALKTGAVVTSDIHDERVVELARGGDGIDDASDLVIGLRHEAGVDLHHPRG